MNKPEMYDTTPACASETEPLITGGHRCTIQHVAEVKSKSGMAMLVIEFDTDIYDSQPCYFAGLYLTDPRFQTLWPGSKWLLIDERAKDTAGESFGIRNLKQFIGAVEESNPDFRVSWGKNFCSCFKGKKVGIVFGREEYLNSCGYVRQAVAARYFRSIEGVEEAPVPRFRPLSVKNAQRRHSCCS